MIYNLQQLLLTLLAVIQLTTNYYYGTQLYYNDISVSLELAT